MKLSEALILRADTHKRVQQINARLRRCARVQEGEQPLEDPATLLGELDGLLIQLADLIARINRSNLAVTLESGTSLTEALAERDVLRLRTNILRSIADAASEDETRYSRSEIKTLPTVNVADLRRQVDSLAQRHRELDTSIQTANWANELVD